MDTFKSRLKGLPFKQKLILIGGLLVIVGAFLPWYSDIDRFNTGDTFLGISGPLYLAGLIVLISGIMSFGIIFWKLLGKPAIKLPVQENYMHLFGAGLSVLMIILTMSVYFHLRFGTNLMDKKIGIGMMLAMFGVGLIILGSILAIKKRDITFEEEGKLEPLININDRVQSDIALKNPEISKSSERIPFGVQKSINSFLEQDDPSAANRNPLSNE